MIGVQCQLMICRGHIRASKGRLFQIFLWLTVLWQIDILVQFYTLVFISSQIWKGCKWVRRSKILSGLNLNGSKGIQCKNRKNFYWRVTGAFLQVNNIKVPFGITPPPPYTSYLVYICAGGFRGSKSSNKIELLGGLSLHLNHLIESRMTNYDWPFGTLPFGLFCSNLDTKDLETYPRTYSGHLWNMSIFDDSRAIWVLFRKWVVSENQNFLDEGAIVTPLSV